MVILLKNTSKELEVKLKYKVKLKYEVTIEKEVEADGKWGLDRAVDAMIELGLDATDAKLTAILNEVDVEGADL